MDFIPICFFVAILCGSVTGNPCANTQRSDRQPKALADPADCASFYICLGSIGVRISCESSHGVGSVFDPWSKNCVRPGSEFDHSLCNKQLYKQIKPEMTCQNADARFIDPENCARYFRCEAGLQRPLITECPYPRLYSAATQSCEVYMHVKCGTRWEPKDPCDYEANQCRESGCVACNVRFASCISLPDGPNIWRGRRWTPHYVICRNERVELHGDCRHDGLLELFNPYTRQCLSVSDVFAAAKGPLALITGGSVGGRRPERIYDAGKTLV